MDAAANISGIGNWVGDEIMYQARLHPEQYSNTFSDEQVKRLHDAMMYVCDTAVEANAESDKFPTDWLMKHRWSKGKKESKLPNGDKITFLKVGGRTSAIVPSVQKKTAAVAGDVSEGAEDDDDAEEEDAKPKRGVKRKAAPVKQENGNVEDKTAVKPKRARKKAEEEVKDESEEEEEVKKPAVKRQKKVVHDFFKTGKKTGKEEIKNEETGSQRRSGRLSK
jgi:ribosomal protein S13